MNTIAIAGHESRGSQRAALHKAAVAFEGFFHGLLLRSMRNAVRENPRFHGGAGEKVFRGLYDNEIAGRIAENGGLGIAKMVENQLGRSLDVRG